MRRSAAAFTTSANRAARIDGKLVRVEGDGWKGNPWRSSRRSPTICEAGWWDVASEKDRPELPNCRPFSSAAPAVFVVVGCTLAPEASRKATRNSLASFPAPGFPTLSEPRENVCRKWRVFEAPDPMPAYQ
jgi:hypothetical protein